MSFLSKHTTVFGPPNPPIEGFYMRKKSSWGSWTASFTSVIKCDNFSTSILVIPTKTKILFFTGSELRTTVSASILFYYKSELCDTDIFFPFFLFIYPLCWACESITPTEYPYTVVCSPGPSFLDFKDNVPPYPNDLFQNFRASKSVDRGLLNFIKLLIDVSERHQVVDPRILRL